MGYADSIRTPTATMENVASLIEGLIGAWTDYTPTVTGFSVNPPANMYRYKLDGQGGCWVAVRQNTAGTSNATTFTISAPVVARTVTNAIWAVHLWGAVDNGVAINTGIAYISSGSSTIQLNKDSIGTAWTNSGNKRADFMLYYEVAP